MGRTECNRVVSFCRCTRLIGQLVDVRILTPAPTSLRGEVLTREGALRSA